MHLIGYLSLGFMWARMAKTANDELEKNKETNSLFETKIASAKYFFKRHIPETELRRKRVLSGSDEMMNIPEIHF